VHFAFRVQLCYKYASNIVAKVEYNQILPKKTVIMDNDPFVVLSSSISKKDRQKASNAVKMKNLRTGGVVDKTFHQADVLQEADIEKREVKYLYNNRGEYFFCPPQNPSERFSLSSEVVGDMGKYVTENTILESLVFDDAVMSILTPIKVELKVTEASEAVKGNTSSGATKEVTLETGLLIQVPQFINQGDIVSVNTESGLYSERVTKA
jgi:elongation factor P